MSAAAAAEVDVRSLTPPSAHHLNTPPMMLNQLVEPAPLDEILDLSFSNRKIDGDSQEPKRKRLISDVIESLSPSSSSSSASSTKSSDVVNSSTDNKRGENAIGFKCDDCHRVLATHRGLTRHRRVMHAPRRVFFYCQRCGRDFRDRRNFRNHQLAHDGVLLFHCDICSASFSNRSSCLYHRVAHELDGSETIPKEQMTNSPLLSASAADDGEKNNDGGNKEQRRRLDCCYRCSDCGQVFYGLRELKKHKIKRSSHKQSDQSPTKKDETQSNSC